jgi:hypothetical protein
MSANVTAIGSLVCAAAGTSLHQLENVDSKLGADAAVGAAVPPLLPVPAPSPTLFMLSTLKFPGGGGVDPTPRSSSKVKFAINSW